MSDQTFDFLMHNIEPDSTNIAKSSLGTNYATITDIQQGANYSAGIVTYNNTQLQGQSDGCFFHLKDAIVHTPMQYTLSITGGTFETSAGTGIVKNNINAVSKKSNKHFIHNTWCKFGGADLAVNNGAGYQNLYMNEVAKARNPNLSYLNNEQECFYLDSVESFNGKDPLSIESNNASLPDIVAPYNKAIYQRNKLFYDNSVDVSGNAMNPLSNLVNSLSLSQNYYPYFVNGTTSMNWYDIVEIPLKDLNDVYGKCPPVIRLNGFEVKIQYNAGSTVQYKLTLPSDAIDFSTAKSESVTTGNGATFPLMLSDGDNTGKRGLTFVKAAGTNDIVLILTVKIGWDSNQSPTRILIPFYKLSNNALTKLTNQRIFNFSAKTYEIDMTLTGISATYNGFNRQLATHYRQMRRLFILPFLSNTNLNTKTPSTNILSPYQNARSSAPNTISPLRLKNFNVLIGGTSLFPQETQTFPVHFYDESFMHQVCEEWSMGNDRDNPLKSGSIQKYMWLNCYGVYVVDLNRFDDEATDKGLKSLSLSFSCDGNNVNLKYDFFVIVECERDYSVDCIEGTLQPLSLVSGQ